MTIRTDELRIYTLASEEAVTAYLTVYYPNHEVSLQELFGVTVHGYWRPVDLDVLQVYVLLSYPEGVAPDEVRERYRTHPDAAANMPGFDPSVIRGVSVTLLAPPGSWSRPRRSRGSESPGRRARAGPAAGG